MQQPSTACLADQPCRFIGGRFGDFGSSRIEYSGRGSGRRKAGPDGHRRGSHW
jgi:hypothetical protein